MTPLSDSEAATVRRFEDAEPAPESWGGGLREAIAKGLGEAWITSGPRAWEEQSEGRRAGARHLADAVLALPELAALRAKANAVDRVEAALSFTPWHVNATQMRRYIRAALDGPPC